MAWEQEEAAAAWPRSDRAGGGGDTRGSAGDHLSGWLCERPGPSGSAPAPGREMSAGGGGAERQPPEDQACSRGGSGAGPPRPGPGEDRCDSAYGSGLPDSFASRCSLGSPAHEVTFDPWAYLSEEGDTFLHLCVIHQAEALALAFIGQCGPGYLNWQNDLFQTPLHLATYTQQTNIVRHLVVKGADTELQDRNGNSPLHLACLYSLEECIQALTKPVTAKERGCLGCEASDELRTRNLEQHNWQGLTCLHLAVHSRSGKMVDHLLSSGAKVDTQEVTSGRTALHLAVELGEVGLVLRLLHADCDVDAPMYNGCTPLHLAVGRLDAGIATALCRAGANPLLPNLEEETPLDLASSNWNVLDLCPFDDVRLRGRPVAV
ncbi:NF-kappa-B inhibitor epsilon-like isoform X2 [Scyliorhinus torazame]|uniref:NF-kappa-B inhibitor epsilon-like isoform X2 n=1 Tax=Scyliorhinus torazame TaxID=75743 RepID=UPI003B5A14A7